MDTHPLDGFIFLNGLINLCNLCFACVRASLYLRVAVHTNIGGRDVGVLAFDCARVAILTINFKLPCVYFVREGDRLCWLIALLNSYSIKPVNSGFEANAGYNKYGNENESRA